MPYKPKTYKPAHARTRERARGTANERGYNYRWQKESKRFLEDHPLCECQECKDAGRAIASEVVDHIIPHRGDHELFWREVNWMAMAKRCHDRKTAKGQ